MNSNLQVDKGITARLSSSTVTNQYGFIDFYGYVKVAGGWWFGGWMPFRLRPDYLLQNDEQLDVTLSFRHEDVSAKGRIVVFDRADIVELGKAFLIFVAAPLVKNTFLIRATCTINGEVAVVMRLGALANELDEATLIRQCRMDLGAESDSETVIDLRQLLSPSPRLTSTTTLDQLKNIFFAIDHSIACQNGLLLMGWMFDPLDQISQIVLRSSNGHDYLIDQTKMLRTQRHDINTAFSENFGDINGKNGFIVFLDEVLNGTADILQIVINTRHGMTAIQELPAFKLTGLNAIRKVLSVFSVRYDEVEFAFSCIGAGINLLNITRLAKRPTKSIVDFGKQPEKPRCSVIVPLYGRCDFLEYQLCFFSEQDFSKTELIYVLDDPARHDECLHIAETSFLRFGVPFKIVLLSHNVGFAPANNIALEYARGDYVCFLNSDVMPATTDWLEQLISSLEAHPHIGIIGPLLVFEDETVQHIGMDFEQLREFGNWFFPRHINKGALPPRKGTQRVTAVTGACMLMQRRVAQDLKGFDESFIIGDFEDSDLCLRLKADLNLHCAIDTTVKLYHLERQSQLSSRHIWRMNTTLYNAWLHHRRWHKHLQQGMVL